MRVYLTGMNTFSANENMSTFSQASQVGTNSLRRPMSLSWSLTNSYLFMIWLKGFQLYNLPQGQFDLNLYVPLSPIEIWKFMNLIHFRKYIDKMYYKDCIPNSKCIFYNTCKNINQLCKIFYLTLWSKSIENSIWILHRQYLCQ